MTPEKGAKTAKAAKATEKKAAEKKAVEKKTDDRPFRLDTPAELRRTVMGRTVVRRQSADTDRFGRFAEQFARFMGTARFLIYMTLFVVLWIGWNAIAPHDLRFDDYPFIFLTLMLSLQASYAAPLILLAQNRQEQRDRAGTDRDRRNAAQQQADMEFLARETASLRMALGEVATRDFLRSELRGLLTELEQRDAEQDAEADEPAGQGDEPHGPGPADPDEASA